MCLRKVHPNVRYNPSLAMRLSQATSFNRSIARTTYAVVICDATLQRPLLQTSPSPWPSAFPLPLHPLEEEGGTIKRAIAIQTKISYISGKYSLLSKGLRGGKSRRLRVVSLLRHMLQSVRSKRPHRTALLWTQVQRLPDQTLSIPRIYRRKPPFFSKKSSVSGKSPTP